MNISDLLAYRLYNQRITNPISPTPEDLVDWFGAVQAQDFAAAKWAIGLRSQALADQQVEDAFNNGKILRMHILRPTWHFVTPKDIRWMLSLTKDRVHQFNKYYYKQSGLDSKTLEITAKFIAKLLVGKTYLTREEIGKRLQARFRFTQNSKLTATLIVMYAELEGIICSGPRLGKQFTYALLEERVPHHAIRDRESALAELTLRYFQSHGPATLRDFVWWSGLTTKDAQEGILLQEEILHEEKIEDTIYWNLATNVSKTKSKIYLLPNYDEFIVGYTNRNDLFDKKHIPKLDARANPLFQHTIVFEGKVIGTWKRELKENTVTITKNLFIPLGNIEGKLLEQAIQRFGVYLNKPIKVISTHPDEA